MTPRKAMQIAGSAHRLLTDRELSRVEALERWLCDRQPRLALNLTGSYVHTKTVSVVSGGCELHLPLLGGFSGVSLVVDINVVVDTLSIHWALEESDGPTWPSWTAGEWPWPDHKIALQGEVTRPLRVTGSRWGSDARIELQVDDETWFELQSGRLVGRQKLQTMTISA